MNNKTYTYVSLNLKIDIEKNDYVFSDILVIYFGYKK